MAQYFLQPLGAGARHNLHSGLNTVGRNPTNDVRLAEPSVSSFHCEIEVAADRVLVRDLQSTNGTRLNNTPVEQAEVRPGDELGLGQMRLLLDCETPMLKVAPPKPPEAARAPQASAFYQCSRCEKIWEAKFVKLLILKHDTAELRFCPACSGRCVVPDPQTVAGRPTAEPALLNRLSRTIQIGSRQSSVGQKPSLNTNRVGSRK